MEQRDTVSFVNAAAAGRLVVALLFAANGLVYMAEHSLTAMLGLLFAVCAAACGYFACSAAAYLQESEKLTLASIVSCVVSGIAFVLGA